MPQIRDTLFDMLQIVRENLDIAIDVLSAIPGDNVVISNIAFADSGLTTIPAVSNKVVITLIKTEEEAALKNQPAYRRHPVSGNLEYLNPPVFLNAYLLITANYENYELALTQLSRVIGYFQYKKVFTDSDNEVVLPAGSPVVHFDFNVSMVSLGFEQINHIWSVLGGKQRPSILYKMQLVEMVYIPDEAREAPIIDIIELNEKII